MTRTYQDFISTKNSHYPAIPASWLTAKLSLLASKIGSGKTPSGGADNYKSAGILFLRSQNVYDDGLRLRDVVYINEETDAEMANSRVRPGDILFNITGASIGRTCIVPDGLRDANVNQHVCIVRLVDRSCADFVSWALKAVQVKSQVDASLTGAARDGLNFQQLGSLIIPLPPLPEQQAIAAFLDRETGKIDALVEEQRRLIALLREKRQAVISHAVTRGLDPTAPLKPSGIDWLGDIPAHWEVMRVKRCIQSFEQGWSPQCDSAPADVGQWGVLKVGCVNGGTFRPEENKALPDDLDPIPALAIRKDDLLISRANTLELVGSAAVVPKDNEQLMICDKLYRLRCGGETLPRFLACMLSIPTLRAEIMIEATGASSSMQNIAQATIKELAIPHPDINEQNGIMRFIDDQTARLNDLLSEAESSISLLVERRAALISAAVTGKIDVRDIAPDLTEVA